MKIVVVEDEKVVLDDLPARLHVEEYTVLASASGDSAGYMTEKLHPDGKLTESIRADEPLWTQGGCHVLCITAHPDELPYYSRMNLYLWRWRF
jgi:hypothetical protein